MSGGGADYFPPSQGCGAWVFGGVGYRQQQLSDCARENEIWLEQVGAGLRSWEQQAESYGISRALRVRGCQRKAPEPCVGLLLEPGSHGFLGCPDQEAEERLRLCQNV